MALMLRMSGIPARVVSGFSPGLVQQGQRRVPGARPRRPFLGGGLLHRHRLGHVRPHPRRRRRPTGAGRARAARSATARSRAPRTRSGSDAPSSDRGPGGDAAPGGGDGGGSGRAAADRGPRRDRAIAGLARRRVAAAPARASATRTPACTSSSGRCRGWAGRSRRARRCWSWSAGWAGWRAPAQPGTSRGCARAAIRPRGARPPGRAARRALRRELTAAGGPIARLRGFRALPPRGPAV